MLAFESDEKMQFGSGNNSGGSCQSSMISAPNSTESDQISKQLKELSEEMNATELTLLTEKF
jgi:hypothetical protein